MTAPTTNNTNTKSNTSNNNQQQQLPVVIAGAGPCGLVVAYCLKKYKVPFVLLERASRSTICSNAGSGFELAPTSVEILQNRLGVNVSDFMSRYGRMNIVTVGGKKIRRAKLPEDYAGGSVNRAEMQQYFLDLLFPSPKDEEGVFFCGWGVESYEEDIPNQRVVVTLVSGRKVTGCLLLACDGIHSRCRAVLHGGYDSHKTWESNTGTMAARDPLHYCGAVAYWGKTRAPEGSELIRKFDALVGRPHDGDGGDGDDGDASSSTSEKKNPKGAVAVLGISTRKIPASFFVIPSQNYTMLNWAFTVKKKDGTSGSGSSSSGPTGDLTRRGGGPLTPSDKERLFGFGENAGTESLVKNVEDFSFLEALIGATPAEDITEAGLYDRENLDQPYTSDSKLVALLGDSAHPQTPFMGQGVNMAITDAYVYATNIALALRGGTKSLRRAVQDSDQQFRRREAKKVVETARQFCDFSITQSFLATKFMQLYGKYAPTADLVGQVVKTDKSNRHYLKHLDTSLCGPKQQEELRQDRTQQQEEERHGQAV